MSPKSIIVSPIVERMFLTIALELNHALLLLEASTFGNVVHIAS